MKSDSQFENLDLPSVGIVRTTPRISREELFSYKRCYMGVSLDNPVFGGRSLHALLLWAVENFDQCLVVVGDYLQRINERILNGLKDDAASRAAQDAGDLFMRRVDRLLRRFPARRIHLTRWKPYLQNHQYRKSRAVLDDLFASDSDFRASVERDAFAFTRRQTRRNRPLAVPLEDAIDLSCRYLLEEIAVFNILSEQGWKVELYPGPELSVLVDIAKGSYMHVPRGLKERINVELKISENPTEQL